MNLLIICDFGNGPQTLIKTGADELHVDEFRKLMEGKPEVVARITCRLTLGGPDRERLVRAGAIRAIEIEQ